jgi:AcrR family transcriptional regulator
MTRRDELLQATAGYILQHGVADLSLRPLAKAIGTKARLLIYHFGSREKLIEAALTAVLRDVQADFLKSGVSVLKFWKWATLPANLPYARLVFEVHGLAPRNPRLFGGYVRDAIDSWKAILSERIPGRNKAQIATAVIAVFDGLLMDFLATGDRQRTTKALRLALKKIGGAL